MRVTDGYAHEDSDPHGAPGDRRRSSMRATEGNLDIADDHIERHIARTLAIAASRRRASLMQVGGAYCPHASHWRLPSSHIMGGACDNS